MGHLSATKQHRQLDLIAAIKKFSCLTALRFEIMVINLWPNADLFQFYDMLIAAGLPLFSTLLVTEAAIVHETADGRHGIGRHFNEIEPALARHLQRIARRYDSDLRAFIIDQAYFTNSNPLVHTGLCRPSYSAPPQNGSGVRRRTIKTAMNATTKGSHRL